MMGQEPGAGMTPDASAAASAGSPGDPDEAAGAAQEAGASSEGDPAAEEAADASSEGDPAEEADAGEGDPAEEAEAPSDVAAQEQEELWRAGRARAWHERTWLRALAVIAVLVGIAAIIPYPLRITSECTINPSERIKVRSELPGVIAEILVDEGQAMKKGDVIARLDDRALRVEREKAAADLEKIQAARPEEADAAQKRARAELAYVDERLAMALIRAPIDGEILTPRLREHLHEGVEAGGLVCEIANTRRMRAEILVPEREVDGIAVGMPAVVKVESYPTRAFEGKVDFIAPTVDSDTRRIRVAVELGNDAGLLRPNMTGFGEIEADKRSLLNLATRRVLRWIRVRFLI